MHVDLALNTSIRFVGLFERALKAPLIRHSHHAACICYKNKVLSYGVARYKTHPLQLKYQTKCERVYLHAEIDAIIKTINKFGVDILKECDLYVLRLTKGKQLGCSKPCEGCERAINAFGLKKVYWS